MSDTQNKGYCVDVNVNTDLSGVGTEVSGVRGRPTQNPGYCIVFVRSLVAKQIENPNKAQ